MKQVRYKTNVTQVFFLSISFRLNQILEYLHRL